MRRIEWTTLAALAAPLAVAAAEPEAAEPAAQAVKLGGLLLAAVAVLIVAPLGLIAIQALVALWCPRQVRQGSEVLRRKTGRCLLAGIVAAGLVVCCLAVFARLPEALRGIPVLILLIALVVGWIRGLTIVAFDIGDRMLASLQSRHQGSAVAATVAGGVLLMLTLWLPGVGQLVHLVLGTIGLGAGILGRLGSAAASAPAVDAPPASV